MLLILILVFGLLWLMVARHARALGLEDVSRRSAFVVAFALFQVLLVLITEGSSAFHAFTTTWVLVAWCLVAAVLALILRQDLVELAAGTIRAVQARDRPRISSLRPTQLAAAVVLLAIFGVLAFIGWAYPLNNADSLVYHVARVAHWIENQSVAAYATHYLAQVELSPLHEYNMAQLQLLAGTDRLDGYVQLFATLICVVGVSDLARRLGLGRNGQLFAALVCATTPNVILEATSTQNNNFSAAIGLAAVLVAAPPWPVGTALRGWLKRGALLGCLAALSALVKGTLVALVWPAVGVLVATALWLAWRQIGARLTLRGGVLGVVTALLAACVLAGPFFARNVELFGGLTGPVSAGTMSVDVTPAAAVGNVIRSAASEFPVVEGGQSGVRNAVSSVVAGGLQRAYNVLGVDQANPDYTLGSPTDAFATMDLSFWDRNEGLGSNPLQVCLMILTLVVLGIGCVRGGKRWWLPFALAIALCVGFVIFSGISKWTVYAVRYYVPLLVLWSPLIALAMRRLPRPGSAAVMVILVVACLPQLFNNETRSLLHPRYPFHTRLAGYFAGFDPHTAAVFTNAYRSVAKTIADSSCRSVGIANWVMYEYPLWPALHNAGWHGELEDVNVANQTSRMEKPKAFRACALIRQESGSYTNHDPAMEEFSFFDLALSIDRADVGRAHAAAYPHGRRVG